MNAKIPVRSAHIDYEHLYERIKMYRKEKNIKQHEIAIQLGYEPANYGKIERGDRPMSLSVLAEICLILEVPLEEMLKGCLAAIGKTRPKFLVKSPILAVLSNSCWMESRAKP